MEQRPMKIQLTVLTVIIHKLLLRRNILPLLRHYTLQSATLESQRVQCEVNQTNEMLNSGKMNGKDPQKV